MKITHTFASIFIYLILSTLAFLPSLSQAANFESLMMPGKLIDGHKKLEDNCSNCHSNFSKTSQSSLCIDCHEDIDKDIKQKHGFHGKNIFVLKQECKQCHTDHIGRDVDIINLDKQTFNHQFTDFKLNGKHKQINCQSCHLADKKYREAKSTCIAVMRTMIRTIRNSVRNVIAATMNHRGKNFLLIMKKPTSH